MSVERKNSYTTPVSREDWRTPLKSASPNDYPVLYSEDAWDIIKADTELSTLMEQVQESVMNGTYTQHAVNEAFATAFNKLNRKVADVTITPEDVERLIREAISTLSSSVQGSSNGVYVSVSEREGKLVSVNVSAPNFDEKFDKNGAARDVLGSVLDSPSRKTVYGAFSAIEELSNNVDSRINAMDSRKSDESNGVMVEVIQHDGVIRSVNVSNSLVGTPGDSSDDNTIYAAKKTAKNVLGKPTDSEGAATVYGAYAAVRNLRSDVESFSGISEDDIRSLFCGDPCEGIN